MVTDAMIEAGRVAGRRAALSGPDLTAVYTSMHAARPTADLGEDGELVDWLNEVRTGTHGDITLHSGMAAIRLGKARDRLILYREALDDVQQAEAEYRLMHDRHGDGSQAAGRAWDLMRRAGDKARAVLSRSGG